MTRKNWTIMLHPRIFPALASLFLLQGGCVAPAQVVEVEGLASYDGEPMPAGIISFVPEGSDGKPLGGGAISKGKYKVYPESGLKPGKYRVEIRWGKPTGEKKEAGYGQSPDVIAEALPAKYHGESILTAELKPGMNTVDFNLEK